MAKIAKSYRTIFAEGQNLQASDVRRAFSDAYDLVNGGLELNNFQAISFNQCAVITNTSTWSSTSLFGAIGEIYHPGYHDIHTLSFGLNAINIFPGRIMINGKLNYNNTRIVISASDHALSSLTVCAGEPLIVLFGAGSSNNITASDIFFERASNISASLAWNNDKQGYYPSIGSGTKRAVMCIYNGYDSRFLDPPWKNHNYKLTSLEQTSLGFCNINTSVWRFYDQTFQSYFFILRGQLPATTGTSYLMDTVGFPSDFVICRGVNMVNDNIADSFLVDAGAINITAGTAAQIQLYWTSQHDLRITTLTTQAVSSYYNARIEYNRSIGPLTYSKKIGNRG